MGVGVGYGYVLGAAAEATASHRYGVPVTDRIPVISDSLSETLNWIEHESLNGSAGREPADLASYKIGGGLETECRYTQATSNYFSGNDLLISMAMGTVSYTSGATSNQWGLWNQMTLANTPSRYLSLAGQKSDVIWNWVSMIPRSMEISGAAGGYLKAGFEFAGYRVARGSGVASTGSGSANFANGTAQMASLASTATSGNRILFNDFTFRIGTFASSSVASATHGSIFVGTAGNIGLGDFKVSLNGEIEEGVYSTPEGLHGDGHYPLLPIRTGFRTVNIEFTLPRYTTTASTDWGQQLETWKLAQTSLALVGYTSLNSGSRQFAVKFPKILIKDIQVPQSGPDVNKIQVKAQAYRGANDNGSLTQILASNASVTSGAYITEEFVIEQKNTVDGRTAVIW